MKENIKERQKIRLKGRADQNSVEYILEDQEGNHYHARVMDMEESEPKTLEELFMNVMYGSVHSRIIRMREKVFKLTFTTMMILMLLSLVFLFVWEPLGDVFNILLKISGLAMLLGEAITITIMRLKKDEDVEKYLKYQVATNKVRNAYFDLGKKVPTLEEAKKAEGVSADGMYLSRTFVIAYIFWGIFLTSSDMTVMLVALTLAFTAGILEMKKMIYFFQYLIYSKPDNRHYIIAIECLKSVLCQIPEDDDTEIVL